MSSRREEERNEKIIRGLMKLPPNRRCINCNSLGPQYVCTNFWTFVCTTCSGIHREFTHRVKSVSMAKFTSQEVEALQRGGNQRAREIYLKDWDSQRHSFPSSSNVDRIRDFIKSVYVDKRFVGTRAADKPPRDTSNQRNNEDDIRRASSYHSFSQSPPYEHEYEERRYGKQIGTLTRRSGSDRVHYEGKISSFIYSPGRLSDHVTYEDRFANESPGSTIAEYHDQRRVDVQSPNFQGSEFSSPVRAVRDIIADDGRLPVVSKTSEIHSRQQADAGTHPQRTVPLNTLLSADNNPTSLKSDTSSGLVDVRFDPAPFAGSQQPGLSFKATNHDPFNFPPTNSAPLNDIFADVGQQQKASVPPIDLFADVNHQWRCSTSTQSSDLFASVMQEQLSSEQKLPAPSFSENKGWATFDSPQQSSQPSGMKNFLGSSTDVSLQQHFEVVLSDNAKMQGLPVQGSIGPTGCQWNAFDPSSSNLPASYVDSQLRSEVPVSAVLPPAATDQTWNSNLVTARSQSSSLEGPAATISYGGFSSPSLFLPSVAPSMEDVPSNIQSRKTTNPFDVPDESDNGISNKFLDMSSLQAALPNSQLPAPFVDGFDSSWFQSSSVPPYMPPAAQGGLTYMRGQASATQLPNMPPQGHITSLGGNPFA